MGNNLQRIKDKLNTEEILLGTTVSLNDPEISDLLYIDPGSLQA